ncbi:MAG: hypothetical protein RIR09_1799 [Pseudomonadota bacterium]
MTPAPSPMAAVAQIAALRTQRTPPFDPVRLHFLEAMARRTQAHQGTTQRLLEAKLTVALQDYQARAAQAPLQPAHARAPRAPSALAELTRQLAQQMPTGTPVSDSKAQANTSSRVELKSVRYFRDTWSQLSLDRQMTQALAQAPENAGPLNSQQLVLRALSVMRSLSPDYFQHFMSYANSLLWLEHADSKPPAKSAAEVDGGKKPKTTRTRTR